MSDKSNAWLTFYNGVVLFLEKTNEIAREYLKPKEVDIFLENSSHSSIRTHTCIALYSVKVDQWPNYEKYSCFTMLTRKIDALTTSFSTRTCYIS